MNHPQRFAQTATLRELDVDAIYGPGQLRNISGNQARFVSENRQPGAIAHETQTFDVVGRNGLLEHLHSIVVQKVAHAHRVLGSPGSVGIDSQPLLRRCVADDAHDFHIAISAELDL